LIENAIKHGTSTLLGQGKLQINAYLSEKDSESVVILEVIDNAGNYHKPISNKGLGTQIVDKRIKNQYGEQYGLTLSCDPGKFTKATIIIPVLEQQEAVC